MTWDDEGMLSIAEWDGDQVSRWDPKSGEIPYSPCPAYAADAVNIIACAACSAPASAGHGIA